MNNFEAILYVKNNIFEFVIFDKKKNNIFLSRKININIDLKNIEILVNEITLTLKKEIIEIETKIDFLINQIILLIEFDDSININACIKKNFDNAKVSKEQIEYLIQDLKQQISKDHSLRINHIVINEFIVDGDILSKPPLNKSCDDLIINLKFICFPEKLILFLEKLFKEHQIEFKSVLCSHYVKSFFSSSFQNIFETAIAIKEGHNINEVSIIPKKPVKMGFFERFFHIFS